MSKHTPGPWVIRYARNKYPYQIDAPNGDAGPGGITSVTRWAAISFPSSEEGHANARLIAAAPELLEALKELTDLMEHVISGDYTPDSFTTQPARLAIAKAEGSN